MTTNEPECVAIKRKGAEQIQNLLAGKNMNDELEFWNIRTDKLKKMLNKRIQRTADHRR